MAISIETDAQWKALTKLCSLPDCATWTAAERAQHEDSLVRSIAAWVAQRSAQEVESRCQAHGVPAHCVLWPKDLYADPQLTHREFFQTLHHPEMGTVQFDGHVTKFSSTPPKLDSPGPLLGEHGIEIRQMFS